MAPSPLVKSDAFLKHCDVHAHALFEFNGATASIARDACGVNVVMRFSVSTPLHHCKRRSCSACVYYTHVRRYPWVKRWEVWNEYIGSFVEPGSPATANKPLYYTQMIAEVKKIVKGAHPDVLLGGGARRTNTHTHTRAHTHTHTHTRTRTQAPL